MNIHESRNQYFHINGSKPGCAKRIESQQLQTAVELWLAKDSKNKIKVVQIGVSGYKHIGSRYLRRVEGGRL